MIDQSTRESREAALRERMAAAGVDVVAVAPTDNLRYLIGFSPLPDERACMLLISARGSAMVMPGLNADQTAAAAPEVELVRWNDSDGADEALRSVFGRIGLDDSSGATLAVDSEMRADHLLFLQSVLAPARTVDASAVIAPLRTVKDSAELALLQRSAAAADAAMLAAFDVIRAGMTEMEVADVIASTFAANESVMEFAIVGGGPNGAFPHHHTGGRVLQEGDAIVLDIGGVRDGYVSDMTRMAFIGEPSDRYREVHAVVEAAVAAAMAAAKPGATCAEVDAAARGVITDAGYGEYFVHRTGHGLGISTHEEPWIMAGNDTVLEVGNVHSIEPGIYLPGAFGIRLEDIIHITDDGCARFSALPREVRTVG